MTTPGATVRRQCDRIDRHELHYYIESDDGSRAGEVRYHCLGIHVPVESAPLVVTDDDWEALFHALVASRLSSPQGTSRLRVIAETVDSIIALGFTRPPM